MKNYERRARTVQIKRIAIFIIAILLLQILFPVIGPLKLVPFNYASDNVIEIDNIRYTLYNLPIYYCDITIMKKDITNIEIPSSIEYQGKHYSINRITTNFSDLKSLKSITIPPSLVNSPAFYNASSIEEIEIVCGLSYKIINGKIDEKKNLEITGISIPNSNKFQQCKNLKRIRLDSGITKIGNNAFKNLRNLTIVHATSDLTEIGDYAFYGCTSLENFFVTSPNSIKTIGNYAFYNCTKLTSDLIDKKIKKIGDFAFYKCRIPWVRIPKEAGTVEIGNSAFAYSGIGSIEIKCNISAIKDGTFFMCDNLRYVSLPNSVKTIGISAFYKCGSNSTGTYIPTWKIPYTVTSIGESAFAYCKNMNIQVPDTVTSIGTNAFSGISGKIYCDDGSNVQKHLKKNNIKYYSTVHTVDKNEYYLNGSEATLKTYKDTATIYTVPSQIKINEKTYKVTKIASGAFKDNTKVERVYIPNTVKYIGYCVFQNCKNLYRVDIPKSVTEMGPNILVNCKNGVKIGCIKGSYAETYAKQNKISYTYIEDTTSKNNNNTNNNNTNNNNTNNNNTNNNSNNNKNNYVSVDRTAPTIQNLKFSPQSGASKSVTVSWTAKDSGVGVAGWKISKKAGDYIGNYTYYNTRYSSVSGSKTFYGNGTYYLYVIDGNGYTACSILNIRTIDSTVPTITSFSLNPSSGYTNKVTVKWTAKDSGVGVKYWKISTKKDDWKGNYTQLDKCYGTVSKEKIIDKNGTYYLYIMDNNGNAVWKSFTINCIDKTQPEITSLKIENKGNKAYITYSAKDDMSGLRYWKLATKSDGSDGSYERYTYNGKEADLAKVGSRKITVTKSGTYYLVLKDAAGNIKISNAITIKIDTTKPYITKLQVSSSTGKNISKTQYLKNGSKLTLRATFNEDIKTVDKNKIKLSGTNSTIVLKKVDSKNYDIIITGGTVNGNAKLSIEQGFLTDNAGNQSNASTIAGKIKIVVDNSAPLVSATYENNKVTAKITDASQVAKYQWKIVDDNGNAIWTGKLNENVNKNSLSRTLTLNKYKGKIATLYVEDVLGNKKTYTIKPPIETSVQFVSRKNNTLTYRITTNLKAQIYEYYKNNIQSFQTAKYCKVTDLKAEDSSGKKFLLTVECTNNTNVTETITLPSGTIYVENPHSSEEKEIEIIVDNTKPIISLGKIPEGKQTEISLSFNLKDSESGIKKYQITRLGTVLRTKTINSKGSYTDSITLEKNGVIKLTVWDNQENESETTISINNIDRDKAEYEVQYSNPDTSGKVEVTISANENIKAKDSTDWENIEDKKIKRVYDESQLTGTGIKDKVTVVDEAGNETIVNLKDEIAPRVVGTPKKTLLGNGSTRVEIELSEKIKETDALKNAGWSLSDDKCHLTKDITTDEELTVEDLAGNEIEEVIKIEKSEGQVAKLYRYVANTPSKRTTPTTEVVKKIYLTRPIEKVDLLNLEGKVECELLEDNKVIKLTYKQNVASNEKIRFIENENYSETLTIIKVSNIVIKGDSNNDGVVDKEDLTIMRKNAVGTETETDEYKLFAMDMNDNGTIGILDVMALKNLLKKK